LRFPRTRGFRTGPWCVVHLLRAVSDIRLPHECHRGGILDHGQRLERRATLTLRPKSKTHIRLSSTQVTCVAVPRRSIHQLVEKHVERVSLSNQHLFGPAHVAALDGTDLIFQFLDKRREIDLSDALV
jgi:hypothetical protein